MSRIDVHIGADGESVEFDNVKNYVHLLVKNSGLSINIREADWGRDDWSLTISNQNTHDTLLIINSQEGTVVCGNVAQLLSAEKLVKQEAADEEK